MILERVFDRRRGKIHVSMKTEKRHRRDVKRTESTSDKTNENRQRGPLNSVKIKIMTEGPKTDGTEKEKEGWSKTKHLKGRLSTL